ncbi:MAG TPA: hypothetical protein VGI60_12705 [Chthoniobacterales bacterium]
MTILPNASANGYHSNANADISQDIERALHGIRDRKEGVLRLPHLPNEENPGGKADQLNQHLHRGELTDPAGGTKRATNPGAQGRSGGVSRR